MLERPHSIVCRLSMWLLVLLSIAIVAAWWLSGWRSLFWVCGDASDTRVAISQGAIIWKEGDPLEPLLVSSEYYGITAAASPGWHVTVNRSEFSPDGSIWAYVRRGPIAPYVWWPKCVYRGPEPPTFTENWHGGTPHTVTLGMRTMLWAMPLWIPLVATVILALLTRGLAGWRRFRKGMCPKCGYDLQGNISGVCPECGAPVRRKRATA